MSMEKHWRSCGEDRKRTYSSKICSKPIAENGLNNKDFLKFSFSSIKVGICKVESTNLMLVKHQNPRLCTGKVSHGIQVSQTGIIF